MNIYNIAHDLRSHCFAENVAGIVIALPGTLKNENPELMEMRLELCPPVKKRILELESGAGILGGYLDLYGEGGDEDEDEDEDE
ncbi:hypothetical protein Q3G72_022961 [Acer saccharum]|nr:hypothetical protein Q3G72_022961 [Acer saccharum]